MSQLGHLRASGAPPTTDAPAPTPEPPAVSNDVMKDALAQSQDPQDVVLYLTLNNTTHRQDEIPESLAALKQAEHEGLGHRDLMAISDPYWSGEGDNVTFDQGTYAGVFGAEAAERVEWWHGADDLESGQVRIGEEVKSLGTSGIGDDPVAQAQAVSDWRDTVMTLGMDGGTADILVQSLLQNDDGSFRELDSGNGATNELVQFIMAMHRAEQGQMDVSSIVFSGHHYDADYSPDTGRGIWGEVPGQDHVYDDTDDYFSLVDVAVLKSVFPNAYAGVKSVQLAACNTDSMGMQDEQGNDISTNAFLQGTFENIEMSSYWKQVLAPVAASGAESNGEFLLDAMRSEGERSDAAAKDSRHNMVGLKRSLLNEDGELEEIRMATSSASYQGTAPGLGGGAHRDGLRDVNQSYTEREDLADHLFEATSMPDRRAPADAE